jgi:hypothetical protein
MDNAARYPQLALTGWLLAHKGSNKFLFIFFNVNTAKVAV